MKIPVVKNVASSTTPKGENAFLQCTWPICELCLGEHRLSPDPGKQSAEALNYEAWKLTTVLSLADTPPFVIEGHPARSLPEQDSVTCLSTSGSSHLTLFPFIMQLPEDLAVFHYVQITRL